MIKTKQLDIYKKDTEYVRKVQTGSAWSGTVTTRPCHVRCNNLNIMFAKFVPMPLHMINCLPLNSVTADLVSWTNHRRWHTRIASGDRKGSLQMILTFRRSRSPLHFQLTTRAALVSSLGD